MTLTHSMLTPRCMLGCMRPCVIKSLTALPPVAAGGWGSSSPASGGGGDLGLLGDPAIVGGSLSNLPNLFGFHLSLLHGLG